MAEPIEHYAEDMKFYMDGKEIHIAGYEEVLLNKELFQEELLAGKKFKLETETNLFFISGLAAVILAMTVFIWRVDVNKKKYARIYRFFFKD